MSCIASHLMFQSCLINRMLRCTGDLVAIKEIDAGNFRNISQIEQIQEEINVLSNLKHANIIHLLESIFIGKMVYVIMEYVAGGSLMDFVNSQVRQLNLWLVMPLHAVPPDAIARLQQQVLSL